MKPKCALTFNALVGLLYPAIGTHAAQCFYVWIKMVQRFISAGIIIVLQYTLLWMRLCPLYRSVSIPNKEIGDESQKRDSTGAHSMLFPAEIVPNSSFSIIGNQVGLKQCKDQGINGEGICENVGMQQLDKGMGSNRPFAKLGTGKYGPENGHGKKGKGKNWECE